jgi:hypothetical protein
VRVAGDDKLNIATTTPRHATTSTLVVPQRAPQDALEKIQQHYKDALSRLTEKCGCGVMILESFLGEGICLGNTPVPTSSPTRTMGAASSTA